MPSSAENAPDDPARPAGPPADLVVDLFLTGRTLRGTLGRQFVSDVVELFLGLHGAGETPRTSISRTVELTAVAVTRAGPVRVELSIDDAAFSLVQGSRAPRDGRVPNIASRRFRLDIDDLDGITPLPAARAAFVEVESPEPVRLRVHVVSDPV